MKNIIAFNTSPVSMDSGLEVEIITGCTLNALEIIMDEDFDINLHKDCLGMAAFYNQTDVVMALIEAGADIDYQDKWGDTAIHEAIRGGNSYIGSILMDFDADLTLRNLKGMTPGKLLIHMDFDDIDMWPDDLIFSAFEDVNDDSGDSGIIL